MSRQKIDWEQIRREYAEGASFRALGTKYGIDHSGIGKRAKREGWQQDRKAVVHETATKLSHARARAYKDTGESRAERMARVEEAAEKLAVVLDRVCTGLEKRKDYSNIKEKELNGLRSLATALKVNGEQLMTLYGLNDPYRKEQLAIAREKLEMEKRQKEPQKETEPWRFEIYDLTQEVKHADDQVRIKQETARSVSDPAGE